MGLNAIYISKAHGKEMGKWSILTPLCRTLRYQVLSSSVAHDELGSAVALR